MTLLLGRTIGGVQRKGGVFARGGGGSQIIGVVRAPFAITHFASNPCEDLCVCIGFNKEVPHKNTK